MKKKPVIIFSLIVLVALILVLAVYRVISGSVTVADGERAVIYIPEGSSYAQVMDSVKSAGLMIENKMILDWIAGKKGYPQRIRPGRFVVEKSMSYSGFINMLRSGRQSPVNVTFNNIRTINDLAGVVSKQIEADSADIVAFFCNPANYSGDGFTGETILSLFIPDTYELYWNTDPAKFYARMLREYNRFWNDKRLQQADKIGLTGPEVSTLASIIDHETTKADEKPLIAGVYLNRLKRGIPLQADPTIKFAVNDFTMNRILNKHLLIDSPYNTYKYKGLPPGPITCPSIESIDAVLNAAVHDYLFFAARPDFSGYHNFSRTLREHNRNAAMYQRELNRRKIFN